MADVNVKILRSFLALVEERSTIIAGRRLGIPQSRVRDHVSALERAVGKPLLKRRFPPNREETGRTQLTEEGHVFLPRAVEALRAYDRMFDEWSVQADPREHNRVVALALLEKVLSALKHDLSDEERERIDRLLD